MIVKNQSVYYLEISVIWNFNKTNNLIFNKII